MDHNILLVDDQRDILRMLHAALDTLKNTKLKIVECQSGEEALLESSRHKIDLMVTDYKLPGITGVELIKKLRARNPDMKVIIISGVSDRKSRDEVINAGTFAIFDKPISIPEFLDAVERGLGFVNTIFSPELKTEKSEQEEQAHATRPIKLSNLFSDFRQEISAEAVFLINQNGFVQARAGAMRDDNLEASLVSVAVVFHNTSLKVISYAAQKEITSYHVFSGGHADILFIPLSPSYILLVTGAGLAAESHVLSVVKKINALRGDVERSLKAIGGTGELRAVTGKQVNPAAISATAAAPTIRRPERSIMDELAAAQPAPEMEALLKGAGEKKPQANDTDDFWNQAAEKHGNKPASKDVMSLEDARKMGLLPDE